MIRTDIVTLNGKQYQLTTSDDNRYVVQRGTGYVYNEAYDIVSSDHVYDEGDVIEEMDEI